MYTCVLHQNIRQQYYTRVEKFFLARNLDSLLVPTKDMILYHFVIVGFCVKTLKNREFLPLLFFPGPKVSTIGMQAEEHLPMFGTRYWMLECFSFSRGKIGFWRGRCFRRNYIRVPMKLLLGAALQTFRGSKNNRPSHWRALKSVLISSIFPIPCQNGHSLN